MQIVHGVSMFYHMGVSSGLTILNSRGDAMTEPKSSMPISPSILHTLRKLFKNMSVTTQPQNDQESSLEERPRPLAERYRPGINESIYRYFHSIVQELWCRHRRIPSTYSYSVCKSIVPVGEDRYTRFLVEFWEGRPWNIACNQDGRYQGPPLVYNLGRKSESPNVPSELTGGLNASSEPLQERALAAAIMGSIEEKGVYLDGSSAHSENSTHSFPPTTSATKSGIEEVETTRPHLTLLPANGYHLDQQRVPTTASSDTVISEFKTELCCRPKILPRELYPVPFLAERIIQRHIKEVTQLPCIPEIFMSKDSPPGNIDDNMPGLSFLISEYPLGVDIRVIPSRKGSDEIQIHLNGRWRPLTGRKKQRFLDDLARIQVSLATFTSPHLGPLLIQRTTDMGGIFPVFQLDKETFMAADIVPFFSSVKEYLLCLLPGNPFLFHLSSIAVGRHTPIPGPYPFALPSPIWGRLLVHPKTGEISHLDVRELRSVPWEIASRPPLKLSPRSRERYTFYLKRHFGGCLLRIREEHVKFPLQPRLDQLAFDKDLEIIDLISKARSVEIPEKIEELEREMLAKVLGRRDYRKCKMEWVKQRNK